MVRGKHRLRIGGEYRRSQVNFYFNAFSRGFVQFSPTFANFLSFATFLQGGSGASVSAISIIGSGVYDRALRTNDLSALRAGRLEIQRPSDVQSGVALRLSTAILPKKCGRLVNFIPEQFRAGTAAVPAGPPNGFVQAGNAANPLPGVPLVEDTLIPNDKNNFAPRVGFAYLLSTSGHTRRARRLRHLLRPPLDALTPTRSYFNFPYLALGVGLLIRSRLVPGLRTFDNPFIPCRSPTLSLSPRPCRRRSRRSRLSSACHQRRLH